MNRFDAVAGDWDKNKMHWDRSEAIAKELLKNLTGKNYATALEFGAGTGILSILLKDHFSEITLMDSSQEMVNVANSKIAVGDQSNLKAVYFDLEKENYSTQTFDVILSQMVLHHVNDIALIFNKFNHLLNPGGMMALADLYPEDGSFHGEGFTGQLGFDPNKLENTLVNVGFETVTHSACFTIKKTISNGIIKDFPIFLLIAFKSKEVS
jgi:2-polyprenyl-3-methyl-5-hydroxy-6-metoxy-1,4-benzoquinol methylase